MERSSFETIKTSCLSILSILWSFLSSFQSESVQLNGRKYKIIKQLGEGGFSYVYHVKDTTNGASYALKRIRVQLPEQESYLKQEIAHQRMINSPYVVKLIDSCLIKQNNQVIEGLLLLPFYSQGTLQDLINRTVGDIPALTIVKLGIDLCKGLEAFHTRNPPLAFRDLKPANVLLDSDGHGILMDLGSVASARVSIHTRKEALELQELCAETATAPFRAPELFDPPTGSLVTEKSDIWSLGCTMYNLCFKNAPFDGTYTACLGAILWPHQRYGHAFEELIRSILQTDSALRPTLDELKHSLEVLQAGLQSGEV